MATASRSVRNDHALLAAMFVLMASTSVVFPLLAELQDAHRLPTSGLGIIAAGPFFAGFLVQPAFARFADRGHSRLLMTLGLAIAGISLLGMAIGTTLVHFAAARAVSGIAIGLFLPAARANAAGGARHEVAHHLGRLSSAELAGLVAGPVAGAAMASALGLTPAFVVFAVATLAVAAIIGPQFPDRPALGSDAANAPPTIPSPRATSLLRRPAVIAALLLVVAVEFPVGMFESMFARYLTDRGASALFIGLTAAVFGLPFVVLAARGGRLADRAGPARAAAIASLVVAPIIAAYGFPDRPGVIAALTVIEACFQAVAIPASRAAMVFASPPGHVAAGQGLAGAASLLATGMAALASPVLYELGGSVLMCSTIGVGVVLCVLGAVVVGWRDLETA